MDGKRTVYRKLPGHRRGFLFGSSVWLGPDHLLLVKSSRFREEYRRFYFRDIQAIVWAAAPRFHLSTRSAAIGAAWLLFTLMAVERSGLALDWIAGVSGVALIGLWAWLSGWESCRCRVYTAVSAEELPSVYRLRTARRFLKAVEPHVIQAQGSIEGLPAQAVEERQIGPLPEGRLGLATTPAQATTATVAAPESAVRTPMAILFVASLCLGGVADLATLGARAEVARWVLIGFLLLQMAAAVGVVVQSFTGRLRGSLRNLAIAAVAAIGVWYYAVQMGAGMAEAFRNEKEKQNGGRITTNMDPMAGFVYPASRGAAGGIGLLVGLAGLVLLLRGERPSEEKVSFNV